MKNILRSGLYALAVVLGFALAFLSVGNKGKSTQLFGDIGIGGTAHADVPAPADGGCSAADGGCGTGCCGGCGGADGGGGGTGGGGTGGGG